MNHTCAISDDLAKDRPHSEPAGPPMLPGFALDRWRVFNCSAFRRLQYKTQVFVTDEGDHYRTRLTHTLEVAQISRILAERLGLNPVLTEVIAIVHDLGHPPFGHAGEAALQEMMGGHGGFDHNLQALRVIDLLEHPYRYFHGLNLANVVRWAHQLHSAEKGQGSEASNLEPPSLGSGELATGGRPPAAQGACNNDDDNDEDPLKRELRTGPDATGGRPPAAQGACNNDDNNSEDPLKRGVRTGSGATGESSAGLTGSDLPSGWLQQPLEGQVTNLADRIAYDVHDIEDALLAGLVSERDLQEVRLWRLAAEPVRRQWPDLMLPAIRRHILDAVTLHLVEDLVATTQDTLAGLAGQDRTAGLDWEALCRRASPAVAFSSETEEILREHEAFLTERAYRHPHVAAMDYKARLIIRALFDAHVQEPRLLPVRYFRRVEQQGVHRVVCDYIAGMTDRFCQDTYHTLFEPFQRL